MKKFLPVFFLFVNISFSFSQQIVQDPYSGVEMKLSADRQFLFVTKILPGSPADLSPLNPGSKITEIENRKISEMDNIVDFFLQNKDKEITLGLTTGTRISISRVTINLFTESYTTECQSFYRVLKNYRQHVLISDPQKVAKFDEIMQSLENPQAYHLDKAANNVIAGWYQPILNPEKHNEISLLSDQSKDISSFQTFDFDYSSQADPLLEKTLLNKLEVLLKDRGVVRNTENPDLLIIINFYSGQKEQYIPPQQIISTKIYNYYNWYWGYIPVPVTESKTKEGYTEINYLNNITIKFLDAKELANSKVPPVIWSASYSEVTKKKFFLSDLSEEIFRILLSQFPVVSNENASDVLIDNFTYTGMLFKSTGNPEYTEVADVIPGSPADQAGIQKGDLINWEKGKNDVYYRFYRSNIRSGDSRLFKQLEWMKNRPSQAEPITFQCKRNGKNIEFAVNPEYRKGLFFEDVAVAFD